MLGVPRDSDRATVRRAYAAKLKVTHPEDDPAGFMALREAYETALAWVDRPQSYDWDEDWDEAGDTDEAVDTDAADEAGASPLPDTDPGAVDPVDPPDPPDPLAAQRAAEGADLERRIAHLSAGLHGPWFLDREGLRAAFDAVMASPALIEIDLRARVEYQIAGLIAQTVPRSDAILRQALDAFGWEGEGNHPPAVWAVRNRYDEWRLIAMLGGDHPLSGGWRALIDGGSPGWRRRIAALRPGLADQVRQILALADHQVPGIVHSFHPRAVDWWRAHLDTPQIGGVELALVLLGLFGAALFGVAGAGPGVRLGGALASGGLGLGLAFGYWRLVVPRLWHGGARVRAGGPGWRIGLWLALTVLAIAAPASPWIAAPLAAAALALAALMLVADMEGDGAGLGWGRVAQFALAGAFIGEAFGAMTVAEQGLCVAFGVAAAVVGLAARHAIARLIAPAPIPIALCVTMALLIGAIMRSDSGAAGAPLIPWGAAAATGLVTMAGLRAADPLGRGGAIATLGGVVLWAVILIAAAATVPPRGASEGAVLPPPIRVEPTDPMQRLEDREPLFATMRTGNPELHAAVAKLLAERDAGKQGKAEAGRAINDLIYRAYRDRMPRSSASLVAAEMNLRLQQFREIRRSDIAGCAEGRIDMGKLSAPLTERLARHQLRVAATPTASTADMAKGREFSTVQILGGPDAVARLDAALRGRDPAARCDARIAYLEGLMAQTDDDVARTVRASLAAPATDKDSAAKK